MKTAFSRFFNIITISLISTVLVQRATAQGASENIDGSCMKIMEACKAAGYNKSILSENKSLSKNCIQPILNGQKVEGVNVDAKDIEACKAKKSEAKLSK